MIKLDFKEVITIEGHHGTRMMIYSDGKCVNETQALIGYGGTEPVALGTAMKALTAIFGVSTLGLLAYVIYDKKKRNNSSKV
jgi:hypothetical protein